VNTICLRSIAHEDQRYPTVGDWYDDQGVTMIVVSKMSDPRYELLVAVHELVEKILCDHRGVKQEAVDEFDRNYERNRLEGDESEPGDHPDAPYRTEHCFATGIERLLAAELGVVWDQYNREVVNLE
jgi:hypothetical protein